MSHPKDRVKEEKYTYEGVEVTVSTTNHTGAGGKITQKPRYDARLNDEKGNSFPIHDDTRDGIEKQIHDHNSSNG